MSKSGVRKASEAESGTAVAFVDAKMYWLKLKFEPVISRTHETFEECQRVEVYHFDANASK